MYVIVCLDNNNGMMFNHRRQSQDRVVRQKISEITKNSILYMNHYSYDAFLELNNDNIRVSKDFLTQAKKEDYCYVEDEKIEEYKDQILKIYVFRWNRVYPADFYFDLDLSKMKQVEQIDFTGSSHKITMEVYERGSL